MLSAKSESFIENLRLYLVTSGKREEEIDELTEELKDHLIESEKHGKSIEGIIDCTPEQYMDSLKVEMKTDYKGIFKKLPFYFIWIIAYLMMGPAIRNQFELNIVQVVGLPVSAIIGFFIYVFFLQRAGKKQYSKKKFFLGSMTASFCVISLFIILLVSAAFLEPFYKANATGNWIVVAICTSIFIGSALWTKTWFPIWMPALLFISDFLSRFTNLTDETVLIISFASFILVFVFLIISVFVTEKNKRKKGIS